MAYAVVHFINDNLASEVPTNWLHKDGNNYLCWWPSPNTKNINTLIMKRAEPNIRTWMLVPIKVEKYCETFEKARKVAEDENYTSADDLHLGKGQRKKFKRPISCDDDTSSSPDEIRENNIPTGSKLIPTKIKKHLVAETVVAKTGEAMAERGDATINVPEWPSTFHFETANDDNIYVEVLENTIVENACEKETVQHNASSSNYNNVDHKIEQLTKCVEEIKANTDILLRMGAQLELQVKDIRQSIQNMAPHTRIAASTLSTQRVKQMLPIKSTQEIEAFEVLLEEQSFLNEYKTFVLKIGGNSPKETTRNILSRLFSNECSMRCSWKGRRQNFGVAKLNLVGVVKDIILEQHATLTEREIDDVAAEWFRFGKQRFERETKHLQC